MNTHLRWHANTTISSPPPAMEVFLIPANQIPVWLLKFSCGWAPTQRQPNVWYP
ncbi:Os09g0549425 [Oryza sativa Japonica Group]|uniref:Os09g0549425 protein n=1 Tax=Oryza sativa subsp. japonica TaxID=39947 RepID=A0A0P0XQ03_ORYSJ|nr:hypothetical protein EE612_049339 [Oryza sativa]BAT09284.1 Os09g0549425 [Oryza sativa Japonica Group]